VDAEANTAPVVDAVDDDGEGDAAAGRSANPDAVATHAAAIAFGGVMALMVPGKRGIVYAAEDEEDEDEEEDEDDDVWGADTDAASANAAAEEAAAADAEEEDDEDGYGCCECMVSGAP
jgi:hypothetical protein